MNTTQNILASSETLKSEDLLFKSTKFLLNKGHFIHFVFALAFISFSFFFFVNSGDDSQPSDEVSDSSASHHGKETLADILVILEIL